MVKSTYWQLLKNSKRFFTEIDGYVSDFFNDTCHALMALIDGIMEVFTMFVIFVLWVSIFITFPVSLPILAGIVYFRQGIGRGKFDLRD